MAEEYKQVRPHTIINMRKCKKKAKKLNRRKKTTLSTIKSKQQEKVHYGSCTAYQVILKLVGRDVIICVLYFQEKNLDELGTSTYLV